MDSRFLFTFLTSVCFLRVSSHSLPSQRAYSGLQYANQYDNRFQNPIRFVIDENDRFNRNAESMNNIFIVENVCGISLNYETSNDENLKNFCHDSFKVRIDEQNRYLTDEPSSDVRKCFSFLCGWYLEGCDKVLQNATRSQTIESFKCKCLYNYWSQCRCDGVLEATQNKFFPNPTNIDETKTIDIRFGHRDNKQLYRDGLNQPNMSPPSFDLEDYQGDAPADVNVHSRMASDDADTFVFVDDSDGYKPWEQQTTDPFDINVYNEEQRKCFALKKVWFNNQCVGLKSESVCGAGEWLVLKKPIDENDVSLLQAECQTKRCKEKNEVWWPSENKCVTKTNAAKDYCRGKDVLVDYDSFGDGYCTCYDDSGSFENSNECYEFYQQGPCKITEVVTYNKTSGYADCSKDLCFALNHPRIRNRPRRNRVRTEREITKREANWMENHVNLYEEEQAYKKTNDPYIPEYLAEEFNRFDRVKRQTNKNRKPAAAEKKYYAPFGGSGECYKFGPQTMCDQLGEDAQFKFHKLLKVPECFVSTSNALHLIDSRPGCKVDESNNCRQEVKLAQTSELDFLLHLKNQARKKRDTKPK